MFCTRCGNQVTDGTKFCPVCGTPLDDGSSQYTQQQYAQPQYTQTYSAPVQPVNPESPALAICAFIFAFVFAPVGLILGIIGAIKYKVSHKGFCIAAISISSVSILISGLLAAILVPAMIGYANASRVTMYDNTAASVYRSVNEWMLESDTDSYGIKSDKLQEFDVLVADGKWTVSAADPSNFYNSGKSWGSSGSSDGTGEADDLAGGEEALAYILASHHPDITKGALHIVIYDGYCTACAYAPDANTYLSAGLDYPEIDRYGVFQDATKWRRTKKTTDRIGLYPR